MEVVTHLRERKHAAANSREGTRLREDVCVLMSAASWMAVENN